MIVISISSYIFQRTPFAIAAAMAGASIATPLLAQSVNDAQVQEAKTLLAGERFIEALAAAKDATRLDGADYRARYYVAMAYLGLRQFDNAEAEAATALRQAPESAKPSVEKLVATIRSLRQGTSNLTEAETALGEGLIGKASRLYEEAWNAGRNAPDFAFKAAELYGSRLNQPVDAARVLRQIQQALPGSAASDRAETELKALAAKLRQIATARVNEAQNLDWASAAPALQAAEEADPGYSAIYTTRTMLAASSGSADLLQTSIKDLARRNLVSVEGLALLPNMNKMMAQPEFASFMADVIGAEQATTLRQTASPENSLAFLSGVAARGELTFFVGSRPGEGKTYYTWSRRKISGIQPLGQCQSNVLLGVAIGSSSDVSITLTGRKLLWDRTTRPVLDNDFVELGPNQEGWVMTGIGIPNNPELAKRVFNAISVIHGACAHPSQPGKR